MNSTVESLCDSVNALSIQPSTYECFLDAIRTSKYVQSCKSKKTKDQASISSLIDRTLSQSDCIKIGIAIESVLRNFIKTIIPHLLDIKERNAKNKREKDHIFIDEVNHIVYYAEIKANLNLDTEKHKATVLKCTEIHAELVSQYSEYTIKMFLVGARYLYSTDMSKAILNKYSSIQGSVVGVNEYLEKLGFKNEFFSEDIYRNLLNKMAEAMFDK